MNKSISDILHNIQVELKINKKSSLSPFNLKPEPTLDQLIKDDYDKANIDLHGLNINIENPKLSYRKGKDKNGKSWESIMGYHYGEITNTLGADGDPLDIFLGNLAYDENPDVYIVNQYINRKFDEHKIMFGFSNRIIAKLAYLEQYENNWKGFHSIIKFTLVEFKEWLKNGNTKIPVQ